MASKIIILFALIAISMAAKLELEEYDPSPQYSYAYDVQDTLSGDSKNQYEVRNGDIVQGRYSLIEPDGSRRIVDYTADPVNGFNAIVKHESAAVVVPAKIVAPVARISPLVPVASAKEAVPAKLSLSSKTAVPAKAAPVKVNTEVDQVEQITPVTKLVPTPNVKTVPLIKSTPVFAPIAAPLFAPGAVQTNFLANYPAQYTFTPLQYPAAYTTVL